MGFCVFAVIAWAAAEMAVPGGAMCLSRGSCSASLAAAQNATRAETGLKYGRFRCLTSRIYDSRAFLADMEGRKSRFRIDGCLVEVVVSSFVGGELKPPPGVGGGLPLGVWVGYPWGFRVLTPGGGALYPQG